MVAHFSIGILAHFSISIYKEELTRIRGDTVSAIETAETEFKRRFNPVKIALIAFIAGVASGIVSTFLIKRRNGKE